MSLDQAVPKKSNFLAKEDCGESGIIVTVAGLAMTDIEGDNGQNEHRTILKFVEDIKPMVLNQTNKELLKHVTGETTAGGVKGKRIIVYNDPTIMFGNKMVGGIRIKAVPQEQSSAAPAAPPFNDDVPFMRKESF